ncbi:hypothetical protein SSX86_008176 [Deinandra increscens subsp. villosa]|uniref:Uncharacterized protein n=1 Tax=Deinandra increscens subsp. villosa TaxID=3103831 RepID=A0AAP0DFM9_9ASTR
MSISSSSSLHHHHHHHLPSSSDQLRYVHCTHCDTILAVSVPCTSLYKTVTVRCGHCTNLIPMNMPPPPPPPPPPSTLINPFHLAHTNIFAPSSTHTHTLRLQDDRISNGGSNSFLMNQNYTADFSLSAREGFKELPKPPVTNRPPEKRQRVPSAYNRFIKEEIQRIKAGNPDISHREAFSAAAKNWAHFPHIHFGLMPDQMSAVKKTSMRPQEHSDGGFMKDGFFASANVGVSPY